MNVRSLLLCIGLAVSPMVASAQSAQDAIIRQLTEQGFVNISVTTTLLGRVRILAESADLRREIVFNPVTGEILRDFWEPRGGQTATPRPTLVNPRPSGSDGSGGSSASDDDDDNGGSTGSGGGGGSSDDDDDNGGSTGSGGGGGSSGDDDDDGASSGGSGGGSSGGDDDDDDRDDDDSDDDDQDDDDNDDEDD
jgi:hypothetical protein